VSFGIAFRALVLTICFVTTAYGEILSDEILNFGDGTVREWYVEGQRSQIERAITAEISAASLLQEARDRIEEVVSAGGNGCDQPTNDTQRRACAFSTNLSAYEIFLASDQLCRAGFTLDNVTNPDQLATTIMAAVDKNVATISESKFAGRDVFTPASVGTTYPLFEENTVAADCAGASGLQLTTIVIPDSSQSDLDKLMLAYALALSYKTWEYNRPNVEATAELIRQANERWTMFETNVIHDQYPWETLLFNDWLAGASSRFTGTLTHPPTLQIRAIHPVPTAIFDASGGDSLFRPRLTFEVLGLRSLNESDYTPKRALSVIMTLKAESTESNGWGLLYTWKRGSFGLVQQKVGPGDRAIGLVFGIDLANQIDSERNNLMKRWAELRKGLGSLEQQP